MIDSKGLLKLIKKRWNVALFFLTIKEYLLIWQIGVMIMLQLNLLVYIALIKYKLNSMIVREMIKLMYFKKYSCIIV